MEKADKWTDLVNGNGIGTVDVFPLRAEIYREVNRTAGGACQTKAVLTMDQIRFQKQQKYFYIRIYSILIGVKCDIIYH